MKVFDFIVLSIATYRLTVLVTRDACPFHVCSKLREIDRLKVLKCPFCSSVWLSALLNTIYYFTCAKTDGVVFACLIFAMSGIAVMLDRIFTADYVAK